MKFNSHSKQQHYRPNYQLREEALPIRWYRIKRTVFSLFLMLWTVLLFNQGAAKATPVELDIKPGTGVTERKTISAYLPSLKNTIFDTPVFVMDSGQPGANILIIGGTHGNEPAGYLSALVILEQAVVKTGKLVVIPAANRSALMMADMISFVDQKLEIPTKSGSRIIRYGNRFSDIADIRKNTSGFFSKTEKKTLNLNRVYPGKADGNETEQLALAIMTLIRSEQIDFTVDFHEARTPDKPTRGSSHNRVNNRLAYSLISHPRGSEIAAYALLSFEEMTDLPIKLEDSKPAHQGYSHWEIGTRTQSISFLTETPNPGQDRWRRKPDVLNDVRYPLKHRVGVHIWLFYSLAEAFADLQEKSFQIEGLPSYQAMMQQGLGSFLN